MSLVRSESTIKRFLPSTRELREMLKLALPIVTVQVGIMAMGVVDTIMIGHLSGAALASVAVGNMYFFACAIFGMGALMALDPLVSQAVGAGDEPAIARAMQRGLMIALVLTILIALLMLPTDSVLRALRQPAEVIPGAAKFTRIMIPGTLPLMAFTVLRQSLQSMTVVRPIVWGIVIANIVNAFLNWVLIFGNLGMPAMGIRGSAWATSISRILLTAIVLIAAWPKLKRYLLPWRADAFDAAALARMLRLGLPIGFHHILEYGAFASVMILMGMLGTVQLASHQIAINLASLTFMVPFGVSQAGSVLVGQAVGRGDPAGARRAAGATGVCGVSFMVGAALVFLMAPRLLASVYTRDAAVLALSIALIRIAGVFQIFDGLQVVATGILRGVGDTRVPMLVGLLGYWLFGMPVSIWLGLGTAAGALGLWWGLVAGLGSVAIVLMVRVRYRLGGELHRLDVEHEPAASV
jgi:multidrug resistance protein, MATE family